MKKELQQIKKYTDYIKETNDFEINYGLIVLNKDDIAEGKYEILHFVGYESEPTINEVNALANELKTDKSFKLNKIMDKIIIVSASKEIIEKYNDIINEGKVADVENVAGGLKYHNEFFPGYNSPKKYDGKKNYKYRVLAREGDKIKTINFGKKEKEAVTSNKLSKKYWESQTTYN
jgi:hypothetical protein